MEKTLVTLPLDDIRPYERNPRKNDAAVADLMESIKQTGYIAPIIVDENNVILAGHTRYKALSSLGKKEALVMKVEGMTEEQKKKYRLLDNKIAEKSEWDFELLDWELEEIDWEGYDFGFEFSEYDEEAQPEEENIYTSKVNLPQYEITGEDYALSELVDATKTEELLKHIDESDVTEDEKTFLRIAAARHTVIEFDRVAEYYAKATPEMQRLTEEQALVIIDVNDAMKNGYTIFSEKIKKMIGENNA